MRILSLKFKNINSLAGKWELDFTMPEFTDNGLFVITGKTGAGKSSILDAITLALYGRTSRVEIKSQINDVMTRGTNDCFSEIVFDIGGKIWKSSWQQERTRSGKLNPVNRQIADINNNIHADKISGCDKKIVEIVGLTFKQFTKVVLLAQGSFAAFLQADKNEKGELLEQITGTEIYGEISRKVFERSKLEKNKLEKIIFESESIKILTNEEIAILKNEISQLNVEKKRIDVELQIIETTKKQLADVENLQKQLTEAKQKLPNLEKNVEIAENALEQTKINLEATKQEKEKNEKILIKVRELDTKIAEKDKLLNPVLQTINELEQKNKILTQDIEKQKQNLSENRDILTKRHEWATINAKYAELNGQMAAIENQQLSVNKLFAHLDAKNIDLEETKTDLKNKISASENAVKLFSEKEKELNEKEEELNRIKKKISTVLSGKELDAYSIERENIVKFGVKLKELIELEKRIAEILEAIEKYNEFVVSCEKTEEKLSKTISETKISLENLKQQLLLIDENIKLALTIKSLDEHRKSLESGKYCPLCGSTEHPFVLGNMPQTDDKEAKLEKMREEEQQISNAIQSDEKTLTKLSSDRNNTLINKKIAEKQLEENIKKREDLTSRITDFSIPSGNDKIAFLESVHKQKQQEYTHISELISKGTKLKNLTIQLQENEIPQLQRSKQLAEKSMTEIKTGIKLIEQKLENETKFVEEADKQHREENTALVKIFAGYDVENIDALKKCLIDWNSNEKAMSELKEHINKSEHLLAMTSSETESNTKQIAAKLTEIQNFKAEKNIFISERFALFGDKLAEYEEKRIKNRFEEAENSKVEAENSKAIAITELEKTKAIISAKLRELEEKHTENTFGNFTTEALQAQYDEKKAQSDLLSQKIGANCQTLIYNEENMQKNRKKLEEKNFQQQIFEKWSCLNDLIGSLDGKKYRNYAQALTFEHLLIMSNRQLQKMSERYLLKRVKSADDALNPFELSVVDKFQNWEERTAQNLSGGEQFIVSLSLALGLANMAGKNMNINTMFIDEGFGTLDSDYLDEALTSLSKLQNEGKLIGVISHLSELKERIATHIEIIPKGNGNSIIELQTQKYFFCK